MTNTQLIPFSQCAGQHKERVDRALRATMDELGDGCPAILREAMAYSLLAPGKRFRPILTLLAAEACGGSAEAAMPAACAVEMIHAYSLVHDDLPAMDDDDLRRGQPTCHKRFDEATAILAGDALLTLAFEVLARRVKPPEVAAACCAALAEAAGACGMVGGQADDMAAPETVGSLDQLVSIHARKTGAMISVSLKLGGLVAGANPKSLAALDQYGRRLGLAFQITDDLLDVHSDETVTGKRVGKDADRGKLTYPGLLGVAESETKAERLIAEACEAIRQLGPHAERLETLAQYIVGRNH